MSHLLWIHSLQTVLLFSMKMVLLNMNVTLAPLSIQNALQKMLLAIQILTLAWNPGGGCMEDMLFRHTLLKFNKG